LVIAQRVGKEHWYRLADPRIRDLLLLGESLLHDHAAAIATCQVVVEARS
jgi:hypothetical protein